MDNKFFIDREEYDFLKSNPDLENIAYLVVSGSHGYGTNNEGSDIDLRGFLVEDKKYLLGCGSFDRGAGAGKTGRRTRNLPSPRRKRRITKPRFAMESEASGAPILNQ